MSIIKGKNIIVGSSSPHWGSINGSLDDQTDLKNILDTKADSNSPTFVGIPHVPTAINGTNNTQIANTEFVNEAIKNLGIMPLFTHIWQDHIINDASWLRGDTFSWHEESIYKSAYKHLLEDLNDGVETTEIIDGITITYYKASDGHKICLENMESTILSLYKKTGVAWYYIIDTTNKKFKLPRTQYGFSGLRTEVGNFIEPGLPSISHTHALTSVSLSSNGAHTHALTSVSMNAMGAHSHTLNASTTSSNGAHTHTRGTMNITGGAGVNPLGTTGISGAFASTGSTTGHGGDDWGGSPTINFDASRSWTGATSSNGAHTHTLNGSTDQTSSHTHTISGLPDTSENHTHTINGITDANSNVDSIYGTSDTVQQKSTEMYLYFYVGNTCKTEMFVDVSKLAEEFNNYKSENQQNVKVSGNQTISGIKTFVNEIRLGKTNLDNYKEITGLSEKDNVRLGFVRFTNNTNGVGRSVKIAVVDNTNTPKGELSVGIDNNGSLYTSAPTPPAGSNSTHIATTNWCYDPTKSTNLVHKSGTETITGSKTFNSSVVFGGNNTYNGSNTYNGNNTYNGINTFITNSGLPIKLKSSIIDKTVNPSEYKYIFTDYLDKNDVRIGVIGSRMHTDGYYGTYLQAGNEASIWVLSNGTNVKTSAPTPSNAIDNSTQIATTAFVNNFINNSTIKTKIVRWGLLNYSAIISITNISTGYTAPADGVVMFNADSQDAATVNGITIPIQGNDSANEGSVYLPVAKGDVVKKINSTYNPIFIPFKY